MIFHGIAQVRHDTQVTDDLTADRIQTEPLHVEAPRELSAGVQIKTL